MQRISVVPVIKYSHLHNVAVATRTGDGAMPLQPGDEVIRLQSPRNPAKKVERAAWFAAAATTAPLSD
jgi:hypothetical protein